MMGGVAGLAGAWVAGPRKGRFVNGKPVTMHGHNAVLYMAGVLLLWFGFYVSLFVPNSLHLGISASTAAAAEKSWHDWRTVCTST